MSLLFLFSFAVYILATTTYLAYFFTDNEKIRTASRTTLVIGGLVHLLYLIHRYFQAGHTPLTSNHEAVSFFALTLTWAFLSFRWRFQVKNFGTFVTLLVTALMIVSAFSSHEIHELPPALKSNWLPIHASIAIMANAFLGLAFCGGVMYLLQEREIKKRRFGMFFSRLPSLEALDNLNQHCLAIGFPLLTLGIITGSIWAKQAWGAYWHWDPKETWSLITWFLYAALLHFRFTMGWRGRRAAIMAIIGFLSTLFTLWGVSYFLGGVHSYVG